MAFMLLPAFANAQAVAVPSGATANLLGIHLEDSTQTARFRFVVQGLGQAGLTYVDMASDIVWMCEQMALPALAENGWEAREVIISLSDRPLDLGVTDPEATQFFEGFTPNGETCEVAEY